MGAIAGVLGSPQGDPEILRRMLDTMARRGNGESSLLFPGAALLHRAGREQRTGIPQASAGDRTCYLLLDGLIHNVPQLRRELEALGHSFPEGTGEELILHAYIQWGPECLIRLRGSFAFAIYEEPSGHLLLARDAMGTRPLFYTKQKGGLLFASELKTLLAHPAVPHEVDTRGVWEVMLLGPGRTPGCGVFRGMEEVEPGWFCLWDGNEVTSRRYWCLEGKAHKDTLPQTLERVRHLVLSSIAAQLNTREPVCALLSGGLDSSIVASAAAGLLQKEGRSLTAVSLDYAGNDRYFTPGKFQPNSDPVYAARMKDYLGLEHHWVVLQTEELANALDEAVEARDLPGMADVDASLLLLCRALKPYGTVALSGECADEIFGGYPWFRDASIQELSGFPWAQCNDLRLSLLAPDYRARLSQEELVTGACRRTRLESSVPPQASPEERRIREMVNLNFRWFMQTLLDRNDRMSAGTGVELRAPFCDRDTAEYLYNVPWSMKELEGFEKGLLRRAMEELLPPEVLWRKKSPFPKTHNPAYLDAVSQRFRQLLQEGSAPILQIADKKALEGLLSRELTWPWYGQLMQKPQTIAYILGVNHWLEHYRIRLI